MPSKTEITLEGKAGKYVIQNNTLGEGLVSYIYKGEQVFSNAGGGQKCSIKVVLKVPNPFKESQCEVIIDNEAEVYRQLRRHIRIPNFMESGFSQAIDRKYLILGWLDGESIQKKLGIEERDVSDIDDINNSKWDVRTEITLPEERAIRYFIQILQGLQYIHGKGIVHFDLSPDNVLIAEHDEVKIIDFGLAHKVDTELRKLFYRRVIPSGAGVPTPSTEGKPSSSKYHYSGEEILFNKIYSPPEVLNAATRQTATAQPHMDLYMAANLLHLMLYGSICDGSCSKGHKTGNGFIRGILTRGLSATLPTDTPEPDSRYRSVDEILGDGDLRRYAWSIGIDYISGNIDVDKFRRMRYYVDHEEPNSLGRIKSLFKGLESDDKTKSDDKIKLESTKNEIRDYVDYVEEEAQTRKEELRNARPTDANAREQDTLARKIEYLGMVKVVINNHK